MSHGRGGEGKDGGRRGRDRDRESVSVSQDYFLLKIIPCSPVGTHTQTPPQPPVLSLNISIEETSLFVRRKSRPGRECVRGGCFIGREEEELRVWTSVGFNRGKRCRGFIPPSPLRV